MGILSSLFSGSGVINKGLDIVDQYVVDKDKANELKAAFYLQELKTPTIPILDAIHKLGRQILAVGQMIVYVYLVSKHGPESITPELVAGISGAASIYTLVKGKGK